jgi:actin-like ATPase involved in cell morphogenesis
VRNTRSVFPIRLSDRERRQIEDAAQRRQLTIGGFVRQAALAASAVVEGKARVTEQAPAVVPVEKGTTDIAVEHQRRGLVMVDSEPVGLGRR